jgi:hypothetical protein
MSTHLLTRLIFLGLLIPFILPAATRTWTGGTGNTKWNHPNNWNCLCTPSNGDNVVINNTGSSQPTITVDEAGSFIPANITINPGATLIFESGTLRMTGNWSNNGTLVATGGNIEMSGTSEQLITGSSLTSFYGLTVNNTAGISTLLNTNVKSILSMITGNITLNNFMITLGTSGTNTGTLSRTSGIVIGGKFRRWFGLTSFSVGDNSGLFPVGHTSDYRPFYVAPSGTPVMAGTVTVEHVIIYGTKNVNFPDGAATVVRRHNTYWTVTSGDGLLAALFNVAGAGSGWGLISSLEDLRLTLFGSVVASPGTNSGTVASPFVPRTGLSLIELSNNFHMASVNYLSPLPVDLLEFSARRLGGNVELSWKTAVEISNDYYTVERSTDGVRYTQVAKINGSGESNSVRHYTFVHRGVKEAAYYRLKQTDFNGEFVVYFPVLVSGSSPSFNAFPNPSADGRVKLDGIPWSNTTVLTVFDLSGKKVTESLVEAGSAIMLELNGPGIYVVRLTDVNNEQTLEQKVMVSK